jgi:hypothetical protein
MGEGPGSPKSPPRAAASHLVGDLDREARQAIEGTCPTVRRVDLEATRCARWIGSMGKEGH